MEICGKQNGNQYLRFRDVTPIMWNQMDTWRMKWKLGTYSGYIVFLWFGALGLPSLGHVYYNLNS